MGSTAIQSCSVGTRGDGSPATFDNGGYLNEWEELSFKRCGKKKGRITSKRTRKGKLNQYLKEIALGQVLSKKNITKLAKKCKETKKLFGNNSSHSLISRKKLRSVITHIKKEKEAAKKNLAKLDKKCKKTKKLLKHLVSKDSYDRKKHDHCLTKIRHAEKTNKKITPN